MSSLAELYDYNIQMNKYIYVYNIAKYNSDLCKIYINDLHCI